MSLVPSDQCALSISDVCVHVRDVPAMCQRPLSHGGESLPQTALDVYLLTHLIVYEINLVYKIHHLSQVRV